MSYIPTNWVNGQTPITQDNLNKIEKGIKDNSDRLDAVEQGSSEMTVEKISNNANTASNIDRNSFSNAPFVSNANVAENENLRSGYGFHNYGVNGIFLYCDTDGRLKIIKNTGDADSIVYVSDIQYLINEVNALKERVTALEQ